MSEGSSDRFRFTGAAAEARRPEMRLLQSEADNRRE